ncbi:citryl-CoA lyase [bacterium]|nr:citryl-CoA lyase [bacterium]
MSDKKWETRVTNVAPNMIMLRGYPIDDLMGKVSYAEAFYLTLMGELPEPSHKKVLDAILVSSLDHGVTPPSANAAMTVASTGSPLNAAIAAGVLAISRFHGGAIEGCMKVLTEAVRSAEAEGQTLVEAAVALVAQYKEAKKRIPGFGHRYPTNDPRTARLFEIAKEEGVCGQYVNMALAIEKSLHEVSGKRLPINVDGAIAALLCEMQIDTLMANAFFIASRLPGLVAHIVEEIKTQKPMRRIITADAEYTGHKRRCLG